MAYSLRFAVAIAVVTLFSSPACCSLQNITQTQVYVAGEGGYFCFRIPALLFTGNSSLLAFAEGRGQHTRVCDDHGDVHIVVKRSSDLGKTWSNLTVVYQESGHTIGKLLELNYHETKSTFNWSACTACVCVCKNIASFCR